MLNWVSCACIVQAVPAGSLYANTVVCSVLCYPIPFSKLYFLHNLSSLSIELMNELRSVFMLQTTTDGKKTSSSDTVGDWRL